MLHNEVLHNFYALRNIIRVVTVVTVSPGGNVTVFYSWNTRFISQ